MRRAYSDEERRWLAASYAVLTNAELADEFERLFGRRLNHSQINNFARRHKLRKERETYNRSVRISRGGMTDEELAFFADYTPGHGWREMADEFERRFGRRLTRSQIRNTRAKLGVHVGMNPGGFKPGHVPASKGKTWDEYMSPEGQRRIREGRGLFRKGECNAATEARRRHLLDTYEDPTNGTLLVYVAPRGETVSARRWISYARLVWMQHNGRDWPEGHRCVHADHDPRNFAPENLVAVPNDLYGMVVGGFVKGTLDYHDRESLELAVAHARLIRARHAAQKRLKEAIA